MAASGVHNRLYEGERERERVGYVNYYKNHIEINFRVVKSFSILVFEKSFRVFVMYSHQCRGVGEAHKERNADTNLELR